MRDDDTLLGHACNQPVVCCVAHRTPADRRHVGWKAHALLTIHLLAPMQTCKTAPSMMASPAGHSCQSPQESIIAFPTSFNATTVLRPRTLPQCNPLQPLILHNAWSRGQPSCQAARRPCLKFSAGLGGRRGPPQPAPCAAA